ncbi:MAG: alpha/beta hydrolase-fold protein, partial [Pirellulales bacterium]
LEYWVQLPPEYSPDRSYPAVITLHGAGASAKMQAGWWGPQAGRHGYIVLAPEYTKPNQRLYDYSDAAHKAVLGTLFDARRRFSIDSDRVFLSGYSMGGDAAWDIGLAHPDLFAGLVPIVGICEKISAIYWQNAEHLPIYLVGGEKDRDAPKRNGVHLDRMMDHGFPVTYSEYIGRGHEDFYEEIHNLFEWMTRQRRVHHPEQFACRSVRPGDNRFYWAEVEDIPAISTIPPGRLTEPARRHRWLRPLVIEGKLGATNSVSVSGGTTRMQIWLAPDMVDFDREVDVYVNGRPVRTAVTPSLGVLLEDFRTRGDRQKLYWVKVVADRRR